MTDLTPTECARAAKRAWLVLLASPFILAGLVLGGYIGIQEWQARRTTPPPTPKPERRPVMRATFTRPPAPNDGVPSGPPGRLADVHLVNAEPVAPPRESKPVVRVPPPPREPERRGPADQSAGARADERLQARIRSQTKRVQRYRTDVRDALRTVERLQAALNDRLAGVNDAKQRRAAAYQAFEDEERLRRLDREHPLRHRRSKDHRSERLRRRDLEFTDVAVRDAETALARARDALAKASRDASRIRERLARAEADLKIIQALAE